MDIKSYISSGIIEACLTGIASEEDVRQMEILSKKYPEIKSEIDKVQQTLTQFSLRYAVEPPKHLKNAIWEKLNQQSSTSQQQPTSTSRNSEIASVPAIPAAKSVSIWKWQYYAAAAILIVAVSIYFSVSIYQENIKMSNRVAALEQQLKKDQDSYHSEVATYQKSLSNLVKGNMQGVMLMGTKQHPTMTAMVLWDKKSNEVYLSLKHLPEPPKGMQYQLWSIVDGKPVNAGVYNSQPQKPDLQKMDAVSPNTQLFAVTLEKEGGVNSPTLSAMYVAGKI